EIDALDVLDVVSSLVAKSMVQVDERPDTDGYRLLETLRDYGLERLAARGDLERLQHAHATYYLEFADEAAPHLLGADDRQWMQRIGDALPNLRAALAFLRDGDDHAAYARLVFALREFWLRAELYREGLEWLTSALSMGPPEPSRQRAESLAFAGDLAVV